MAAEAEAAREARAKVIAAEGEHKASRALKYAAEIITDNPAALQVWKIYTKFLVPHTQLLYGSSLAWIYISVATKIENGPKTNTKNLH